MPTFIVLYGGKIKGDKLDPETRDRCEKALNTAIQFPNSTIVYCVRLHPLADITLQYLRDAGLPNSRIWLNPIGYNTVTETEGALELIRPYPGSSVIPTTSWYHALRVSMCWRLLGYRDELGFAVSWVTTTPIRSLLREILAIPKSFLEILIRQRRKKLSPVHP